MGRLRKLLWPFGLLYGLITGIRNWLYDRGLLQSVAYDIPIIAVGNLSVGGTGKTPMVEYLIRLLQPHYRVAVLSRGYRRKSSGFVLADDGASAELLGDEPFQIHSKFRDVIVAVDADRRRGIGTLLKTSKPDVILLDDAFQHRRVKAGFYVLLTSYDSLYCDDMMLPAGNLREWASGASRADVIVVTKCPLDLSESAKAEITRKLRPKAGQQVFFSSIAYAGHVTNYSDGIPVEEVRGMRKTLVAGVAKPQPFFDYLKREGDAILKFPDHHDFTERDLSAIVASGVDNMIVTTEKDFVRLTVRIREPLWCLPIQSKISREESFNISIQQYVGKSSGNRSIHQR